MKKYKYCLIKINNVWILIKHLLHLHMSFTKKTNQDSCTTRMQKPVSLICETWTFKCLSDESFRVFDQGLCGLRLGSRRFNMCCNICSILDRWKVRSVFGFYQNAEMGKIALLIVFTLFYPALMLLGKGFDWIVKNPTLHTDSVGYLPLLVIVVGIFLTPHILKRRLK